MQRWLSFHFYNAPLQSDYYYLKLCNEIYNVLRDDDFPDEINPEDIHFLLWYYLSMLFSDDTIISPLIYEWSDHSERIFEILEREYEVAPESFNLKQLFNVSPKEDNFFMIKEKLKWIMLDSWLHHFLGKELEEMTEDLPSGDGKEPLPEESRIMYLYDTMDTFVLSRHTLLLARQGKEWLAHALGKDHPLYESLLEMG